MLRRRRWGSGRASFQRTRPGARATVISICKDPAFTKVRLPRATARAVPAPGSSPRLRSRPLPAGPRERPGCAGLRATGCLAAAPGARPAGTAPALAAGPGGEAPACPGAWCVRGAPGRPDGAGAARGLRAPPGRRRGSRKRAPRSPRSGAQAPLAAGGAMAAGALGSHAPAAGRQGTAAPSALGSRLGSRLGRGHPELWAPVGRAGRALGGGAGAVLARARLLLLLGPRCWGGGGRSVARPRALLPSLDPDFPPPQPRSPLRASAEPRGARSGLGCRVTLGRGGRLEV